MAGTYGTLGALDTLAAVQNTTVALYGIDNAYQAIQTTLDAHNILVDEMLRDLVEVTTDNFRNYGGGTSGRRMQELDEWGAPDTQKTGAGVNVGFPLRIYGDALGWTQTWMEIHSPADMAAQVNDMLTGDLLTLESAITRPLYYPTNVTFLDRLERNVSLPLKALLNADSAAIPPGPNGEAYNAATHTHYLWSTTFTEAAALAQIAHVQEHRTLGQIQYWINSADEATVRAFTGFKPYVDSRILVQNSNAAYAAGPLDMTNVGNRAIGVLGAAEVWVKPYALASYPIAIRLMAGAKPLAMRVRGAPGGGSAGLDRLRLVTTHNHHPLYASMYGREYGIAVWNRDMAAISEMNDADSAYTSPVT